MTTKNSDDEIDIIGEKYFSNLKRGGAIRQPLKQNLQADIHKVEATIRKLSDKQAPYTELVRLRTAVQRLLNVIDEEVEVHRHE